jgi:hypothetical protein
MIAYVDVNPTNIRSYPWLPHRSLLALQIDSIYCGCLGFWIWNFLFEIFSQYQETLKIAKKYRQYIGQRKKDKQWSTQHYTENYRLSNTNPTKLTNCIFFRKINWYSLCFYCMKKLLLLCYMITYLIGFFIYVLIFPGWSGLYSIDRFLYLWSFYHENYKTRARRTWHNRGDPDYVQEGEILRIYLWAISWTIFTNKCTIPLFCFYQKRYLQGICNIIDVLVESRSCWLDILIGWQLYPVIQGMF